MAYDVEAHCLAFLGDWRVETFIGSYGEMSKCFCPGCMRMKLREADQCMYKVYNAKLSNFYMIQCGSFSFSKTEIAET